MLDIKFIRENQEALRKAIENKNVTLNLDELLVADDNRRKILGEIDSLRKKRNELAEAGKKGKPEEKEIKEGREIKEKLVTLEKKEKEIEKIYQELMVRVPAIPSADTPVGKNCDENQQISCFGKIPVFDFPVKTHIKIALDLDLADFEKGAKVGGYRGYYLKNEGALLAMALMMFAFHKMAEKGYTPMIPPTLVKGFPLFGSGYFKGTEYDGEVDEIYQVATSDKEADGEKSKEKKFLVGTAEPSLLAYFSDEVLKEENLPIRVCGFSPCYRSEIGSYGKDTRGLYRVHEFMKVEQVVVCSADVEKSTAIQEEMVAISEEIHRDLGLPYRRLQICTGDMSPGKYRAFDLEAWMPGLNRWGETGSATNFTDWQARRMNIKYVTKDGEKKYAFLLNNTALPSVRPLIAILENYQQKDGSVIIPEVLRKYLPGGMEKITKK
jgi:seryl-tRNA synthetase